MGSKKGAPFFLITQIGAVVDKVVEVLLALLGILIFVLAIAQIFSRYTIGSSLSWTEELSRYLFVWLIFLGAALAVSKKGHMVIDTVVTSLPARGQRVAEWIVLTCCTVFFVFLIIQGFKLSVIAYGQSSPIMEISMGVVYLVIPTSAILMLFNSLRIWLDGAANRKGGTP